MVDRSLLKKLIWLRGSPAGGSSPSYEKTVGPSAILSVTDALRKPALSLIAGMEPVQDLHGYENPWPGGGGKNLADYPQMVSDGAVPQDDGSLYVAQASSFTNKVAWQNDGTAGQFAVTFIVKNDSTSRGVYPVIYYTDGTYDTLPFYLGYTSFTTITKVTNSEKTVDKIAFSYGTGSVKTWFYIQVEKGSTATDWSPYSNICPISGRTGLTAYRCGENVFDPSAYLWYQGTIIGSAGGIESPSNSRIRSGYVTALPTLTYSASFGGTAAKFFTHYYDKDRGYLGNDGAWKNNGASFTTPNSTAYIRFVVANASDTDFTPSDIADAMLQVGSTASAYEPYSGATYPVVFPALTANMWDEEWETGWIGWTGIDAPDNNKIRSKGFIPVVAGETYRIVSSVNIQVLYYDANKDFVSYQGSSLPSQSTFAIPSGCAYIRFYTSGSTYGGTYKNDIAINYPSTKTSYVPYSNTVYGGTVDIVAGTLTVTHADVDLGELIWTAAGSGQFYFESPYFNGADDPTGTDCYCDCYAGGDAYNKASDNTICTRIGEDRQIWVYDSSKAGMTAAQFEAAMDGVRFAYPLANQETYQLDPQTVQMLKGANNLWNDAGDSTLTYVGTEP